MSNKESKKILEDLYKTDFILKDEKGKRVDVPVSGSLGLLAIGYKGLIAWRKKKMENNETISPLIKLE